MAGVSLAWLLDGAYDVTLLEARESIGGNIRSVDVALDGHEFVVDMGAQYFHPGPYPVYTTLLEQLGLFDPDAVEQSAAHGFPASITMTAGVAATPRFVSPILPDRWWPFFAPWNWAGLWAFGVGFLAAKAREDLNQSWDVTLEEWLPTLGLTREQWEGMLLPWAASLFSGDVDQCRGLSARAAMIFAAKALPPNPLDPLAYYVLKPGLIEPLSRMIDQCSTVTVMTGAQVRDVQRLGRGFKLRCADGPTVLVDELVCALSGPPTRRLLTGVPGTTLQRRALDRMEFHDARLALHTDPVYSPSDQSHRSFFNCDLHGAFCEASMWMASVISGPCISPEVTFPQCRVLQSGEAGDGPGRHVRQCDLSIEPRPDVKHPRTGVPLEQTDDGLCLPCRHVVVAGDLASLQMALTVHDEGPPASIDDLPPDNVRRVAVPKLHPSRVTLLRRGVLPVDWWITGEHSKPSFAVCSVYRAHSLNKLLGLRAEAVHDGVVFPCPSKKHSRHVVSAYVAVDRVLVSRVRGFEHDIVQRVAKTRIANQGQDERLHLHIAVWIADRDDVVRSKRCRNLRNRFPGGGRPRWNQLRRHRRHGRGYENGSNPVERAVTSVGSRGHCSIYEEISRECTAGRSCDAASWHRSRPNSGDYIGARRCDGVRRVRYVRVRVHWCSVTASPRGGAISNDRKNALQAHHWRRSGKQQGS